MLLTPQKKPFHYQFRLDCRTDGRCFPWLQQQQQQQQQTTQGRRGRAMQQRLLVRCLRSLRQVPCRALVEARLTNWRALLLGCRDMQQPNKNAGLGGCLAGKLALRLAG